MVVGGLSVRDKPHPVDRGADILRGEAQTAALKALREKTSHRGKDIGYRPAPLSVFSAEPYVSPRRANDTAGHTLTQSPSPSPSPSQSQSRRQTQRRTASASASASAGSSSETSSYASSAASGAHLRVRVRGGAEREGEGESARDFTLYINRHAAEAKSVAMVSRRKHPPLDRSQCSGPKWDPPHK